MGKLVKMQTNLDQATINAVRVRAATAGVSESAILRTLILTGLNNGTPITSRDYKGTDRRRPKICPECQSTEDELGNPSLMISNDKWSCYVCGKKGTW